MEKPDVKRLRTIADQLRLDVVKTIHTAGDGHPGPAMSIAELISVLYFSVLRIDPDQPRLPQRDRFILSKGHACPILYAALARRGFFPYEELAGLRTLESMLQGHPDMNKTPGVDATSGSLGNGVAIGLGMAMGLRRQGYDSRVYVAVGDGEQEEGVIWEAAMAAAAMKADNLTVFADCNNYQSGGHVTDLSSLYPLLPKWEAFGWFCQEIDGHDPAAILCAIDRARAASGRPAFIALRTVKGKGVPYMENNNAWHKRVPTEEEVAIACKALGGERL